MSRSLKDKAAYELILTSSVVSRMSWLSYLDGLLDGMLVVKQKLFCEVLIPEFFKKTARSILV